MFSFESLLSSAQCSLDYMLANVFLAGLTSLESSSIDDVVTLCKSLEFPSDQLLVNISRVLKPGGAVLVSLASQSAEEQTVIC